MNGYRLVRCMDLNDVKKAQSHITQRSTRVFTGSNHYTVMKYADVRMPVAVGQNVVCVNVICDNSCSIIWGVGVGACTRMVMLIWIMI